MDDVEANKRAHETKIKEIQDAMAEKKVTVDAIDSKLAEEKSVKLLLSKAIAEKEKQLAALARENSLFFCFPFLLFFLRDINRRRNFAS